MVPTEPLFDVIAHGGTEALLIYWQGIRWVSVQIRPTVKLPHKAHPQHDAGLIDFPPLLALQFRHHLGKSLHHRNDVVHKRTHCGDVTGELFNWFLWQSHEPSGNTFQRVAQPCPRLSASGLPSSWGQAKGSSVLTTSSINRAEAMAGPERTRIKHQIKHFEPTFVHVPKSSGFSV